MNINTIKKLVKDAGLELKTNHIKGTSVYVITDLEENGMFHVHLTEDKNKISKVFTSKNSVGEINKKFLGVLNTSLVTKDISVNIWVSSEKVEGSFYTKENYEELNGFKELHKWYSTHSLNANALVEETKEEENNMNIENIVGMNAINDSLVRQSKEVKEEIEFELNEIDCYIDSFGRFELVYLNGTRNPVGSINIEQSKDLLINYEMHIDFECLEVNKKNRDKKDSTHSPNANALVEEQDIDDLPVEEYEEAKRVQEENKETIEDIKQRTQINRMKSFLKSVGVEIEEERLLTLTIEELERIVNGEEEQEENSNVETPKTLKAQVERAKKVFANACKTKELDKSIEDCKGRIEFEESYKKKCYQDKNRRAFNAATCKMSTLNNKLEELKKEKRRLQSEATREHNASVKAQAIKDSGRVGNDLTSGDDIVF